ncbi:hypothetical protein [Arthrobacter sp. U41]|uniref:hypothetical protein n=1 Tax=Arthrobacter sp. U41 TaxID=1849032 RepID=UPI0011A4C025|nr:hypothetical protein [Arthrobacter sp. U41]
MSQTTATPEQSTTKSSNWQPISLLVAGVFLGGASGVLALIPGMGSLPVILGAGAAIAAIVLTFTIAYQQNADTDNLRRILVKIEEQTATQDYGSSTPSLPEDSDADTSQEESLELPSYAEEAVRALRERGAKLTLDDLRWRRKITPQPMTGNHGWFVESNSARDGERWFVRKARGLTVRKAMPRDFLEAWEEQTGLAPSEIKLDFQLTDHGLAAWYVRTYSDVLWKVSRSNRNASAGINVSRENTDN